MDVLKIKYDDPSGSGMFCEHNMPCPVCKQEHAVYQMQQGTFGPCWDCVHDGWELIKRPKRISFWEKFCRWTRDSIFDSNAYELILVESNTTKKRIY